MPVNAASQSIQLPEDVAEKHDVQFFVHSKLAAGGADALDTVLPEHLRYLKRLKESGVVAFAGPFFTTDGKNSGNGFYVLRTDNIEKAWEIAAGDPLHQKGLRSPTIEPWLQDVE